MLASTPSSAIKVEQYNLILIWPLAIRPDGSESALGQKGAQAWARSAWDTLEAQGKAGTTPWRRTAEPLHHLRSTASTEAKDLDLARKTEYAEFAYFFPFVQRFLYGTGEAAPMRLYRHTDITGATVTVTGNGARSVDLDVARMNLYVFDSATALLVTEFSADAPREVLETVEGRPSQPLSLATAQTLNDHLRRAVPPFFDHANRPGATPLTVRWRPEADTPDGGPATPLVRPADYLDALDRPEGRRRLPALPWWQAISPDLSAAGLRLDPVLDDRMPAVTFLAVPNPAALSDGDWMRLANFDGAGPDPYPYGEAFVKAALPRHAYDRFWDPNPAHGDYHTRYLFSGFGCVTVARTGNFMTGHLRAHTRRHYFQMALITQFQVAALLDLSDRLAQVLRGDLEDATTRHAAERVLGDLLRFTNAYWFPDVSNQIQAREIFDLWRSHTEVQALHAQVMDEAREANAFLNRLADQRAAESASDLNLIGAVGVVGALATGFMGMNQIVPAKPDDSGWNVAGEWSALALVLVAVLGIMAATLYLPRMVRSRALRRPFTFYTAALVALLVGIGLTALPH